MTLPTGRRRRPAFAAGLATMAMAFGLSAVPAQAAPPPKADYVALGDSYAAGQGAAPYADPTCFVSRKGYPAIADNLRAIELTTNAACSGATTGAVVAQVLKGVSATTDLVTVTVGGNDLDTTGLVATCSSLPAQCEGAIAVRAGMLHQALFDPSSSALVQGLAGVVGAVRIAAPNAEIVFTGYPLLFHAPVEGSLPDVVNDLTVGLNGVIAGVALPTDSQYVDVTGAFAGHGIGSAEPWINFNPANLSDPANFHPNGEGYRHGYYASLLNQGAFNLN